MNNYFKIKQFMGFGLALLLLIFPFLLGCEPNGTPVIDNRTGQDINIQVIHLGTDGTPDKPINYGVVPAGTKRKLASITFLGNEWVVRIEAIDTSGKVIFSENYKMDDLKNINWTITISP